jgi:2-(3-amino-3-carboxypropyl)histidine synthase
LSTISDRILDRIDFSSIFSQLRKVNARKVGVQLPDGLKFYAAELTEIFEKEGFEVIVSGKGSYGACDMDLELLDHCDYLLHFAHTPILRIDRVIYVPYQVDYPLEPFYQVKIPEKSIALIATAQYAWKLQEVKAVLEKKGYEVELKTGKELKYPGEVLGCNYTALQDVKADAVLFVGDGLFHPIGAAIYTGKKVYRLSPLSNEFEEVNVERFIRKRMAAIVKAMDGRKCGIIVSTKPGQKRERLALELKRRAKEKGLSCFVILTDEISAEKIYNFRADFLVNTACPRISYDDAEAFHVPVLTPQEFQIVLGERSFEDYAMDEIFRFRSPSPSTP